MKLNFRPAGGSISRGVTDHYNGSSYQDHWSNWVSQSPSTLWTVSKYLKRRTNRLVWQPALVTELCIQKSWEISDPQNRNRVTIAYHMEHHEHSAQSWGGYGEPATLAPSGRRPSSNFSIQNGPARIRIYWKGLPARGAIHVGVWLIRPIIMSRGDIFLLMIVFNGISGIFIDWT